MVSCTVISGVVFYLVHPVAMSFVSVDEYGVFGFLLSVVNNMAILSVGLQSVFAQQASVAVTENDRRALASTVRGVSGGVFLLWLATAAVVYFNRDSICAENNIANPVALWLTLLSTLVLLLTPIYLGLLQGCQNFLWVGWTQLFNSAGRLAAIAVILALGGRVAGLTGGLMIGAVAAFALCFFMSRSFWARAGGSVDWRAWLGRVVPLTLGLGAFQFMMTGDGLLVQKWFKDVPGQTGLYVFAGTLGRALCAFTGPVVAVMFPKIVRSNALSEKSNALGLTVVTTAVMAVVGALGLCLAIPRILPVFKPEYAGAGTLLPWFSFAMIPLAMSNVLLNHLLARNRYAVTPWIAAVAVAYIWALTKHHGTFVEMLQTLSVASLIFFAVVAFFSWRDARAGAVSANAAPGAVK